MVLSWISQRCSSWSPAFEGKPIPSTSVSALILKWWRGLWRCNRYSRNCLLTYIDWKHTQTVIFTTGTIMPQQFISSLSIKAKVSHVETVVRFFKFDKAVGCVVLSCFSYWNQWYWQLTQITMGVLSISRAVQVWLTSKMLCLPVLDVFSSVCVLHVPQVLTLPTLVCCLSTTFIIALFLNPFHLVSVFMSM